MRRFDIGDRVKILDGRDNPRYTAPGGIGWSSAMDSMVGKVFTLSRQNVCLDGDRYYISGWVFLEESLEPEKPTRKDWVNRHRRGT